MTRASKYLCVEFDKKRPLIYPLNLTEKGLQIFMRIESDQKGPMIYCVESDQKGPMIYCVESDQKGPLINALNLTEKGLQMLLCVESDQKGLLIYICVESD